MTTGHYLQSAWRDISASKLEEVSTALREHFFRDPAYLATPNGQQDLAAHLTIRLQHNRERVIPWLGSITNLKGLRVLEIGCGTGASTVALAEQGAIVTAIDLEMEALHVAAARLKAGNGLEAEFIRTNATELKNTFFRDSFDLIVFYATLEHMTHEERRISMKDSWDMLAKGGLWAVIETPNRLWFRDDHTSLLPFYHWLPDDVAFEYAKFSKRPFFREMYGEKTPEKMLHFLRRGRGMSYHEFELFIAPLPELNVLSCLALYWRSINPVEQEQWKNSSHALYEAFLNHACPEVPQGFLQIELDLVLKK